MNILNTLPSRMVKYLIAKQSSDDPWVSRYELYELAKDNGYEYECILDSFNEVEKELYIGMWNIGDNDMKTDKPKGRYYKAYNMSPETLARHKEDLEWFAELDYQHDSSS